MKMTELKEWLERRDRENPEAARLREVLAKASMELSVLLACRFDGWFTQAQAAEFLGVTRGTVNRAVKERRFVTNGQPGRGCRIHPESLLKCQRGLETKGLDRSGRMSS